MINFFLTFNKDKVSCSFKDGKLHLGNNSFTLTPFKHLIARTIVNNKPYAITCYIDKKTLQISHLGQSYNFDIKTEAENLREISSGLGNAKSNVLISAMPGKVIRILVKEGQPIKANDPLVVLEAMKMENELRALNDAVVEKIHVNESQNVEAKALLITFKE